MGLAWMAVKTYPLYYAGKLMPWAKGTVANGFVYLAGTEGRDPETDRVVEGIEAQTWMCMEKIKSWLEEMGSSLENIVKITYYVKGEFPDGVGASENWQKAHKVKQDFYRKHCPSLCEDKNPPVADLIGVSGLALKEMLIEIAVTAVLPDR